jgi:hypothetical protein
VSLSALFAGGFLDRSGSSRSCRAVPFKFGPTVSKSNPIALSVGYSAMISNSPPGECGCFLLNGASGEALFHVWKNVAAVVQLTGDHTGNVPQSQQDLSLVTYMAGPRYPSSCRAGSTFMVNSSPVESMASMPTSQGMMRSQMAPQTRWPFQQVAELKLASATGFRSELLKRNFSPAACPTISLDGSTTFVFVPV